MVNNFFNKYFKEQKRLLSLNQSTKNKLENVKKYLEFIKKNNRKVMIFGNGGSAAIANHFSVDLTKVSKIRCVNFNESSLITCFSNDFGYENWVKKPEINNIYEIDKINVLLVATTKNIIKQFDSIIRELGFKNSIEHAKSLSLNTILDTYNKDNKYI